MQIIDLGDTDDDDDDNGNDFNDNDDDGQQQIIANVKQAASLEERQKLIKDEILEDIFDKLKNNDVNDVNDNIEIIDDEYDDTLANINNYDLFDTSIVDDLFGCDTLMSDFKDLKNLNGVIMNDCENIGNPKKEIIACPICNEKMSRESLDDHLDGCSGIRKVINIKYASNSKLQANVAEVRNIKPINRKRPNNNKDLNARDDARINPHKYMRGAPVPETSQNNTKQSRTHSENENGLITNNTSAIEHCKCPVCNKLIISTLINVHLDSCLSKIPI